MAPSRPHIAIVGTGAVGGWTAWMLRERGAAVTAIDAWGTGHARASSGGETRIIRLMYGSRQHYTRLAFRAFEIYEEFQRRVRRALVHQTGVVWMFGGQPEARGFEKASCETLRHLSVPVEPLARAEWRPRFPQIAFDGIESVVFEPRAGYVEARAMCQAVIEHVAERGGICRIAAAQAPVATEMRGDAVRAVVLQDGTALEADVFLFACGPWLPSLFPDLIGRTIAPTRQESYFFGAPAGRPEFMSPTLPVWIDFRERQIYGIPGDAMRSFKVADDRSGPPIDPTSGDRAATASGVVEARAHLALRFPALASAPLVGAEVCQYEATPDSELILDRHPEWTNVFIAGGGSGHGFKLGPAVGELLAARILDGTPLDPRYGLARFARNPDDGWQAKWT
jgi:sarcosine oxidase